MRIRPIAIVGAVALVALLGASPARAQESVAADDGVTAATNADRLIPRAAVLASPSSGPADSVAERAADPEPRVDAWGAKRSLPLAVGQVVGINIIVWAANEYIRGARFTQISPRSWEANIRNGFTYDDNHFANNQFAHPYHGSMYYGAARSNGFNYWESAAFSLFGSLMWECCGETHPMSINDWIATGVGGAAIGETLYRAASTVLDNTATGSERTWREIGAFALSPVRGLNRVASGRSRSDRLQPNPEDPQDRIPNNLWNRLSGGVRVIGNESSLSDTTDVTGLFRVNMRFGDPFADQRMGPFDYFNLGLDVYLGDKKPIGRLSITANLFTKELGEPEGARHLFTLTQDYQYLNNNAFEFGGQMFNAGLKSRFALSDGWAIRTNLDAVLMLMGAVNSEYAFLAEVPNRERLREYDYGPGIGGRVSASLLRKGRSLVSLFYWLQYLNTVNGSTVNGSDAYHIIQFAGVQGVLPLSRGFGIGADFYVFTRDSRFDADFLDDTYQRVPQLEVYGTWEVARFVD